MLRLIILRLLESYFQHRWLYLVPIVLMIGAAGIYFYTLEPAYTSRGVLYVSGESYLASLTNVRDTSSASWWVTPAQATANEMSELLKTDAFIRALIQQTDLESQMDQGDAVVANIINKVRESVWTYSLGDNQLQINATWELPQISLQLVNGVIDGYVQWKVNGQRSDGDTAQSFFGDLIVTYENELTAAREDMKQYLLDHPEPLRGSRPAIEQIEMSRLQSAIDLAATRYANALDKEESARLALAQIESDTRQTYLMIDAPRLPLEPETSLKDLAIKLAAFLIVGGLLSVGAVVGNAVLDRSLRLPIDVENRLHLPILTVVPDFTPPKLRFARLRRKKKQLEVEDKEIVEIDAQLDRAEEIRQKADETI